MENTFLRVVSSQEYVLCYDDNCYSSNYLDTQSPSSPSWIVGMGNANNKCLCIMIILLW